jgi:hypothetical protein
VAALLEALGKKRDMSLAAFGVTSGSSRSRVEMVDCSMMPTLQATPPPPSTGAIKPRNALAPSHCTTSPAGAQEASEDEEASKDEEASEDEEADPSHPVPSTGGIKPRNCLLEPTPTQPPSPVPASMVPENQATFKQHLELYKKLAHTLGKLKRMEKPTAKTKETKDPTYV